MRSSRPAPLTPAADEPIFSLALALQGYVEERFNDHKALIDAMEPGYEAGGVNQSWNNFPTHKPNRNPPFNIGPTFSMWRKVAFKELGLCDDMPPVGLSEGSETRLRDKKAPFPVVAMPLPLAVNPPSSMVRFI